MIWRCPMRASDSTTDGSVITMSHGQNSWSPALIDVLSRSTAVATDTDPGYAGWLKLRTNPFWVMAHDAQPSASEVAAQAWTVG